MYGSQVLLNMTSEDLHFNRLCVWMCVCVCVCVGGGGGGGGGEVCAVKQHS